MTLNEYQAQAHKFASYGDSEIYPELGLCEEAGEVAGKIAKFVRKHKVDMPCQAILYPDPDLGVDFELLRDDIKKELGDVLWMLQEIATVYGYELDEIASYNIEKLTDRLNRGVIEGEGDNR